MGKAVPYGVYDVGRNEAWVSVGQDGDTAAFAVQTLRRWWQTIGEPTYPGARRLLVCADAGGSNGHLVRLWKVELARLAEESGLKITVCHYPPGTSKWNKIGELLEQPVRVVAGELPLEGGAGSTVSRGAPPAPAAAGGVVPGPHGPSASASAALRR